MSEMTPEEALRLAAELTGQALNKAEARCSVLGQFVSDCDRAGARTPAWSEALRELRALHGYRSELLHRYSLIQQALECTVDERPAEVPLSPPPRQPVHRRQQQAHVQARRRHA